MTVPEKVSPQAIFVKLVLDSQNNINELVAMQKQQMFYIDALFKNLINESIPSTQPTTSNGVTEQQHHQKK